MRVAFDKHCRGDVEHSIFTLSEFIHAHTNTTIGATNTMVLLTSSYFAVRAQMGLTIAS